MFSIFGTSGPLFRGPMEDLKRVSRTLGLQATPPLNAVTDHMDDVDAQPFRRLLKQVTEREAHHPPESSSPLSSPAQQAAGAYQKVQTPPPPVRHPLRTVAEVMTAQPTSVLDTQTLQQGWQALADAHVGQAPVLNAQGHLVGLLTRAELLSLDHLPSPEHSTLVWRAWLMQPVASVMITPVPAALPDTELRRVARVLIDAGLPGLPVVSLSDELVGFVSRTDVLKAVVHDPPLDLWT